jgi:membrane protein YqaA with SNARE-associated domain
MLEDSTPHSPGPTPEATAPGDDPGASRSSAGRGRRKGRPRESLGERAERLAGSNGALGLLTAVSIAESALLPLPVDAVALPMMAAARRRIPAIVLVGALTSVVGGVLGYLIGVFGFEVIGEPAIGLFGATEDFAAIQEQISENWRSGVWIIFLGAVTPIPFKLVCIGAGFTGFPFWVFLVVALAGRVLRFAVFGALFWFFGPVASRLLKRHARLTGLAMVVLIVAGFLVSPLLAR